MTTSINYTESKTLAAVKDWRTTDKAKIGAAPAEKSTAVKKHRHSEQKLRDCADQLLKGEGGRP
ncbi:UNVERIFIED_ORG: hypothetical protein JN05_01250 [Zoogloea ramigera]|uniref:DUF2559 family protein n=1 Tax=Duganella zoogloeoides TaxID=75659 RepID=A0ABZ0Y476_9BURK|nr:hypothetical protein [Duganella zoogloeoides]WQH06856.1 hypothetical protein SR858_11160 [Duganella zoogloeoides]